MSNFLSSKSGKRILGLLYGIGAAVVIIGALFKIMHWKFADIMLIIGLSTEAVIFFVSAFEQPHMEPDWTLVYPELAGMHDPNKKREQKMVAGSGSTAALDKMLDDAKIGPELIQSLGKGMKQLGDAATKLSSMGDVSGVTEQYASSLKTASGSFAELSKTYVKATESLTGIANNPSSVNYADALQKANNNLNALNVAFEQQIKGSSELASNLGKLNTVYGNVLSAMGSK